jgi:hypothetical protein
MRLGQFGVWTSYRVIGELNAGFTADDVADGGSDRLIDAVVPYGDVEKVAGRARQHLAAGANHVCLKPVGVEGIPRSERTTLASALRTRE